MRKVDLVNDTTYPVYAVSAWAYDFLPNAYNLTPIMLRPDEKRRIEINDDFDKCNFVFIADFRNPRQKRPWLNRKRGPIRQWLGTYNLCLGGLRTIRIKS